MSSLYSTMFPKVHSVALLIPVFSFLFLDPFTFLHNIYLADLAVCWHMSKPPCILLTIFYKLSVSILVRTSEFVIYSVCQDSDLHTSPVGSHKFLMEIYFCQLQVSLSVFLIHMIVCITIIQNALLLSLYYTYSKHYTWHIVSCLFTILEVVLRNLSYVPGNWSKLSTQILKLQQHFKITIN